MISIIRRCASPLAHQKRGGLRITPSGQKTYVLKCRLKSGEQRWLTIGEHGSPWTPDMARKQAEALLESVKKGGDPSSEAKAAKAVLSVAELCDSYLAEGVAHKKSGTIVADRGRIVHHIKPLLGKVKVDRLTKADVTRLFTSVREGKTARIKEGAKKQGRIVVQGGEGVARQCVMLLSTMMTFAVERELRSDNPAKGFKKPRGKQMERFLSPAEMERLGESLAAEEKLTCDAYPTAAIRLLALTGCRRDEIGKLEWRHVAWELAQLHLPDSKTGKKAVYLNAPALEVLAELERLKATEPRAMANPYVICGHRPGKPFGGMGKVWERVRKRAGLEDVRLHDLRHSFASMGVGYANLGLPIIGALLGHKNAATTQRYAHLAADPLQAANETVGSKIAAALNGGGRG